MVGVDVSDAKVEDINANRVPFEEPGLAALMSGQHAAGRIRATKSVLEGLKDATLAIVCVGTPSGIDGAHDMRCVVDVSRQIAAEVARLPAGAHLTVACRSTMRPGSIRKLISPIFAARLGVGWQERITLVHNPEFLREAQAIHDYFHPARPPARIVIGTAEGAPNVVMDVLHDGIDAPSFVVRFEEAELTKFVDNSWHAVKVVFANEIGRVCQKLEISASRMHEMFVADTKLNISAYYTRPGGAFGGSCLPKDVRALQYIASDVGANAHLIDSLLRSNEAHKNYQFQTIAADAGAAGCGGRDRGAAGGLRAVSGRIGRADRSRAPVCPAGRRNRASGDAGAGGARAARSARARPAGREGRRYALVGRVTTVGWTFPGRRRPAG